MIATVFSYTFTCNGVELYVVADSASTDGRYDSQLVSWLKLHLLVTRYVLLIDCKNQTVLKLHNPTEIKVSTQKMCMYSNRPHVSAIVCGMCLHETDCVLGKQRKYVL